MKKLLLTLAVLSVACRKPEVPFPYGEANPTPVALKSLKVSGPAASAAGAPCATPRPLPPWAPPGISYCTEARFYVTRCEASPWIQMYQSPPGHTGQICGAHTFAVDASDGFRYPIIDQGANGKGYPKPPSSAPEALAVWTACFLNHIAPGGGYNCNQPAPTGTLIYNPIKLAALPEPFKTSFTNFYACCNGTTPVPTVVPPTKTPVPVTAGPTTPTKKPTAGNPCDVCVPPPTPTVTPSPVCILPRPTCPVPAPCEPNDEGGIPWCGCLPAGYGGACWEYAGRTP